MSGAKSGSFSALLAAKVSVSVRPAESNSTAAQCVKIRLNALENVSGMPPRPSTVAGLLNIPHQRRMHQRGIGIVGLPERNGRDGLDQDIENTPPHSTLKCNTSGGSDRFSGRMMLRIGQQAATVPFLKQGRLPCPRATAT